MRAVPALAAGLGAGACGYALAGRGSFLPEYIKTLGIPIVTCGPGNRLIPHQVDEHVEVAELLDAAKIYVASALNYLKP